VTDSNTAERPAKTLNMGVDNTGFIVDRLGRDCAPLQYVRELTQNAVEAIQDIPSQSGEVVWDVDWDQFDLSGKYKLCVMDNGVGFHGPDQLKYINQLSSSGHEQGHDKNFGVGAKVAGATRNHEGMVYLSWKDGKGHMSHLWRDPSTEQYGIARVERSDGTVEDYSKVTDDIKPAMIDEHGTKVVLLGMFQDHNTMEPPEGVEGRQRWITKYLNTRYFSFPEGVSVKVREGYQAPREDSKRNFLRDVIGMEAFLDRESEWKGTVSLTGATAHVWILTDRPERSKQGDMFAAGGHVAALYQDELYEMAAAKRGASQLLSFGVIFGHSRVVIYVEPDVQELLGSNTARTQLLIDGESLPWDEWQSEFRQNMPHEIKVLMDEVASGAQDVDHKAAIKERLKHIRSLLRNPSRYRRNAMGNLSVSGDTVGGAPRSERGSREGSASSGGRGGRAGNIYALFLDEGGEPGQEVQADQMPEVKWISQRSTPPTRTSDVLEDRAARYLPDQNLLLINADFRVFTDMVDRWVGNYEDAPVPRPVIEEKVQEWFEQALVETVIGAQALQGSPEWTMEDIGKLWSEEALTAASLQRYHVDNCVARTLGSKLGRRQKPVPTAAAGESS
jgi:hypothetical protein